MKSAATKSLKGTKGVNDTFNANKRARGVSADAIASHNVAQKQKQNRSSDWIPTEAVRAIMAIKDKF